MGIVWPFIPARLWPHGKGSPGARCSQRGCVLATLFPYRIKPWVKIHNGYTKHLLKGCLSCTFNFNHGSVSVFSCFSALEVYTGLKESNSSICLSVWQPAGIYSSGRVEGQSKTAYSFWAQQSRVQNWFHNSFSVYEKYIRSLHLNVLSGRCKHLQETIMRGWIGTFHFSNV